MIANEAGSKRASVSLDIETECALGCTEPCDHALDEHRNRITVVGAWFGKEHEVPGLVFRGPRLIEELRALFTDNPNFRLTGYNIKWDLKTLAAKGLDLSHLWEDDAHLMAFTCTDKVSYEYMAWYRSERKRLNALLPKGQGHRDAAEHSLKTVAPFFLGVEPFWETVSHDDDGYVLKDARYAYELTLFFEELLKEKGQYDFYKTWLLPRVRLLLQMERRGIALDLDLLSRLEVDTQQSAAQAQERLNALWADAFRTYEEQARKEVRAKYGVMADTAVAKLKDKSKAPATRLRYEAMCRAAEAKVEPFNMASPSQMTWLMRDHLGLDITDFDGDETTGKAVLQKLAGQGREDIAAFLQYRKASKLCSAFFPSYRAMHVNGIIHGSFNVGPRTGRLSSSRPNLQQIERGIKKLFRARPGYRFSVRDMKAIEPYLICFYTHDVNLYDILSQGKDYHNFNTSIFFDLDVNTPDFKKRYPVEREVGKEVGLSLKYGSGATRLMESAQKRGFVWTKREAQYKVDRFREYYSGVYEFREKQLNPVLLSGEVVTNLLGRPFSIPDPADVHLQGLNTLIQGGASDLVWNSAYKAQKHFEHEGWDASIVILEHDCIITEAEASIADDVDKFMDATMTSYKLDTPLGPLHLATEGGVCGAWEK